MTKHPPASRTTSLRRLADNPAQLLQQIHTQASRHIQPDHLDVLAIVDPDLYDLLGRPHHTHRTDCPTAPGEQTVAGTTICIEFICGHTDDPTHLQLEWFTHDTEPGHADVWLPPTDLQHAAPVYSQMCNAGIDASTAAAALRTSLQPHTTTS